MADTWYSIKEGKIKIVIGITYSLVVTMLTLIALFKYLRNQSKHSLIWVHT